MSKICIIIPVYNEAARLVVDVYVNHLLENPDHYLLFVNDGSLDKSMEILENLCIKNPMQIKVIHNNKNQGKGEAIRYGVNESFNWYKFDYFGFMDADLATPLSQVDFLVEKLITNPEIIMVFGSRIKLLNNVIERNVFRHYAGRFFATFVSLLFHIEIYDTQCGAKFFRNSEISKQLFINPFISKWFFDIEIFIKLKETKKEISLDKLALEIPLQRWVEKGNTKLSFMDFAFVPILLLRLKYKLKK